MTPPRRPLPPRLPPWAWRPPSWPPACGGGAAPTTTTAAPDHLDLHHDHHPPGPDHHDDHHPPAADPGAHRRHPQHRLRHPLRPGRRLPPASPRPTPSTITVEVFPTPEEALAAALAGDVDVALPDARSALAALAQGACFLAPLDFVDEDAMRLVGRSDLITADDLIGRKVGTRGREPGRDGPAHVALGRGGGLGRRGGGGHRRPRPGGRPHRGPGRCGDLDRAGPGAGPGRLRRGGVPLRRRGGRVLPRGGPGERHLPLAAGSTAPRA